MLSIGGNKPSTEERKVCEEVYRQVLDRDPDGQTLAHDVAQCNLAAHFLDKGDWRGAIKKLEKLTQQLGVNPAVHTNLGTAFSMGGCHAKAAFAFETAYKLNANNAYVCYKLGDAYHSLRQLTKVAPYLEQAVKLLQSDQADADIGADSACARQTYLQAAQELLVDMSEHGKSIAKLDQQATQKYEAALKGGTNFSLLRSALVLQMKVVGLILANGFEEHLCSTLANAYGRIGKGICELSPGQRQGLSMMVRAIKAKPDWPAWYVNLAITFREMGRGDISIALYEKAIELDGNNALTHYNLAVAYQLSDDEEHALPSFQTTIALHNNESIHDEKHLNTGSLVASSHFNIGMIWLNRAWCAADEEDTSGSRDAEGQHRQKQSTGFAHNAICSFKETLKLQSMHTKVRFSLGDALSLVERHDDALRTFREAVRFDSDRLVAKHMMGRALHSFVLARGRSTGTDTRAKAALDANQRAKMKDAAGKAATRTERCSWTLDEIVAMIELPPLQDALLAARNFLGISEVEQEQSNISSGAKSKTKSKKGGKKGRGKKGRG
jgi:tetratricopeptide (TPR) repeat protein